MKRPVLYAFLLSLISIGPLRAQVSAKAILDLRSEDFSTSVLLNGEWDFYWDELLDHSKEFTGKEPEKVSVPHNWARSGAGGEELPPFGYATYAVQVLLPESESELGLLITHAYSSYKVLLNGMTAYESGKVATTESDYLMYREPKVLRLHGIQKDTLDLVIQVANYDHSVAGLATGIELAPADKLIRRIELNRGVSMFIAGGLGITGFILLMFCLGADHLSLSALFYAFFSLAMMYRIIGADFYPLHGMFRNVDSMLSLCMEYISIYAASLFAGLFIFNMYPRQTSKWVKWPFVIICSAFIVQVLVLPAFIYTQTLIYFLLFLIIYVFVFVVIVIKARLANEPASRYLVSALSVLLFWVGFQTLAFSGILVVSYDLRFVLLTIIIILCNLALYRTLFYKVKVINQAEADLALQKNKQTMLSLISHEIKMPVATLQMNIEMLDHASGSPQKFLEVKDKLIGMSKKSVSTIKQMLHDFIYFMSTRQGNTDELTLRQLEDFCKNNWSLKVFCHACKVAGPNVFLTDKMTLRYILNTLITNALKYSPSTAARPEIKVAMEEDIAIVEIRDYGPGMPKEVLDRIGESRAHINENNEISGMGLFLAMDLATRLGHHIDVASRLGGGTSVYVKIKRK